MQTMEEDGCTYTMQLIDHAGEFNSSGLDNFVKQVKLADRKLQYCIVAIMGAQSSGKSTLMNHMFHTNFEEMDANVTRSQTTRGIWLAKCVGTQPLTIAMDLEGTDGNERGEDDKAFEKQSALFSLAVSNIVLINMWCHDIGREHAANKPLLRTIFQVMLRLFTPRKTTLLFIIRDKTKSPFVVLENKVMKDIQKIWDETLKPEAHARTPLSNFFNVQVVALSNYEQKEEEFKVEVAHLREQLYSSTCLGGLAGDTQGVVPGSAFSFSAQKIWKEIKENRDLDLPAHSAMVAKVRCEEIANEKINQLEHDEDWLTLKNTAGTRPLPRFCTRLSRILSIYLSEYDAETKDFNESVRNATRKERLESRAWKEAFYPACTAMIKQLCDVSLDKFKQSLEQSLKDGKLLSESLGTCIETNMSEFETELKDVAIQQPSWDLSTFRNKLRADMEAFASSDHIAKLQKKQNPGKLEIIGKVVLGPVVAGVGAAVGSKEMATVGARVAYIGVSAVVGGVATYVNASE